MNSSHATFLLLLFGFLLWCFLFGPFGYLCFPYVVSPTLPCVRSVVIVLQEAVYMELTRWGRANRSSRRNSGSEKWGTYVHGLVNGEELRGGKRLNLHVGRAEGSKC